MQILTKLLKYIHNYEKKISYNKIYYSSKKPPWKIMFFGTDDFSVSSLKCLNNEFEKRTIISKLEVTTTSKAKVNPIRDYAIEQKLTVHSWPVTMNLEKQFDLGIVVSFGHLIPERIINKFPLGIINVHASLLPRWRGAAPIIHTIAHGDKVTGVTIMKIHPKKFDIGEILIQKSINVPDDIQMPTLYKSLAELGATLLIKCVENLDYYLQNAKIQSNTEVTYAPKVDSSMSRINWNNMNSRNIYNLSRALYDLYPLTTTWNNILVKLFDITIEQDINNDEENIKPGTVKYNKKIKKLLIKCQDGLWLSCSKIGLPGKKPMDASDFNNGYIKKEILENRLFK